LFGKSFVETDLFDYQQRLLIKSEASHQDSTSLVLGALDRNAFRAGFQDSDLAQAAETLGENCVDITRQNLSPFFETDRDGGLRSIKLYIKTERGLHFAPPLLAYLHYLGVAVEDLEVSPRGVRFPDGFIQTDSEGRFYPLFQVVNEYDYLATKLGPISRLFLGRDVQDSSRFLALEPVSVLDLLENPELLRGRLTILGRYLAEAEEIEFNTCTGDMARLELYGTILSNLMRGTYLKPLHPLVGGMVGLLAVLLLALILPGRRTSKAIGWWVVWLAAWLWLHHELFLRHYFTNQSATILAGLLVLLTHVLLRSWRVNSLLQGLGGRAPLQKTGDEIIATILFTNLPSVVKDLEDTEPAEAQAARVAHARCVGYVVNQHGGRLVDLQGDAQMIAFGLEGGNHRQQASACALDLVEQVNKLLGTQPPELNQVHCGVVTGPVATGQVGGGQYHGVAAIGDTTNSAARLMGQAKKKGIPVLASAETVSELGPRAILEQVGELTVKGRSEPLKTWEIKSFSTPPVVPSAQKTRHQRVPKLVFLATTIVSLTVASFLAQKPTFREPFLDAVSPSGSSSPILFAGLDEECLEFQPWPWPRSLHGAAVENCLEAGAACVFLDFLFEDAGDVDEDESLVSAVNSHDQVVVGAAAIHRDLERPDLPDLLPGLLEGDRWGLINHAPSNQGNIMRYALWQLPVGQDLVEGDGVVRKMLQIVAPGKVDSLTGKTDFLIRWGPIPKTFSYHRLLDPTDPIFREMSGQTVIIGDNLSGRTDAFETPLGTLKGGIIHAMSLQTLLNGEVLEDVSDGVAVHLLSLALSTVLLLATWRFLGLSSQVAVLVGGVALAGLLVDGAARIGYFIGALPCLAAASTVILGWLITVIDTNQALTNYIPRKLQEQLEKDGTVADMTTIGTILLTDIRGYTTLSEGRSPSEILALLNSYHEKTAAAYEKYGGHLLTYQGDAQIVVFGPLERISNPVLGAVQSARMLPPIVQEVAREAGLEEGILRVGSGITTGQITLSLMGAEGQLQYSVFGAPVRQAHHLQSLSDSVEDNIMLDERSHFAVKDILKTTAHISPDGERFFTTGDS
jgi:adenylate cyclase